MVLNLHPHRLHSNLGWGINYYMFDHYFDFMFPIYREEWFIYAGVGAGLRYWDKRRSNYDGLGVGLLGELGIEWQMRKHFNIGLDITPSYDIFKKVFNNYGSLCLRYRF